MTGKCKQLEMEYAAQGDEFKHAKEQAEEYKNKCTEHEKGLEILLDENRRLGVRAAVSFEELTPRYTRFSETFSELGIAQPKPDYNATSTISSIRYIEGLIKAYKSSHKY